MKISYERSVTTDYSQELSLTKCENCVIVKIKSYDHVTELEDEKSYIIEKDILSDFIGSLLHIQQKLNQKK